MYHTEHEHDVLVKLFVIHSELGLVSCPWESKCTYQQKSAHLSQSAPCGEICVIWQPDPQWPSWFHPRERPPPRGAPDPEQHVMVRWGRCFQTPTLSRAQEPCAALAIQLQLLHLKRTKRDRDRADLLKWFKLLHFKKNINIFYSICILYFCNFSASHMHLITPFKQPLKF